MWCRIKMLQVIWAHHSAHFCPLDLSEISVFLWNIESEASVLERRSVCVSYRWVLTAARSASRTQCLLQYIMTRSSAVKEGDWTGGRWPRNDSLSRRATDWQPGFSKSTWRPPLQALPDLPTMHCDGDTKLYLNLQQNDFLVFVLTVRRSKLCAI